jgi:hypothetical protein
MVKMSAGPSQLEVFRADGDEAGSGKQKADGEACSHHDQHPDCRSGSGSPSPRGAVKRVGGKKAKGIGDFLQEAPKGEGGYAQRQSHKGADQVSRAYSADGKHGCREQDEGEISVIDLCDAVYPEHR